MPFTALMRRLSQGRIVVHRIDAACFRGAELLFTVLMRRAYRGAELLFTASMRRLSQAELLYTASMRRAYREAELPFAALMRRLSQGELLFTALMRRVPAGPNCCSPHQCGVLPQG